MPTTYSSAALAGLTGLPELLVKELLELPFYKSLNDELTVDTLLDLSNKVSEGGLDPHLLVAITEECVSSGRAEHILPAITDLVEGSKANAEREHLMRVCEQADKQAATRSIGIGVARADQQPNEHFHYHQAQWGALTAAGTPIDAAQPTTADGARVCEETLQKSLGGGAFVSYSNDIQSSQQQVSSEMNALTYGQRRERENLQHQQGQALNSAVSSLSAVVPVAAAAVAVAVGAATSSAAAAPNTEKKADEKKSSGWFNFGWMRKGGGGGASASPTASASLNTTVTKVGDDTAAESGEVAASTPTASVPPLEESGTGVALIQRHAAQTGPTISSEARRMFGCDDDYDNDSDERIVNPNGTLRVYPISENAVNVNGSSCTSSPLGGVASPLALSVPPPQPGIFGVMDGDVPEEKDTPLAGVRGSDLFFGDSETLRRGDGCTSASPSRLTLPEEDKRRLHRDPAEGILSSSSSALSSPPPQPSALIAGAPLVEFGDGRSSIGARVKTSISMIVDLPVSSCDVTNGDTSRFAVQNNSEVAVENKGFPFLAENRAVQSAEEVDFDAVFNSFLTKASN